MRLPRGSTPNPAGELTALPRPLAGFWEKQCERTGKEEEGEGRSGRGRGGP